MARQTDYHGTALNLTRSHLELADFHPETYCSLHTSKDTAHNADTVPSTPGMNALPKVLSATVARGCNTMAAYVILNLGTGPCRALKLYCLKLYMRFRDKSLKTACQNTLLPIYYPQQRHIRYQQPQCAKYNLIQHQRSTSD